MQSWRTTARRLAFSLLLIASLVTMAQETPGNGTPHPAAIWTDPGDIGKKDLFLGPGGRRDEPQTPVKFIEEDKHGHNPKFDVEDASERKWKAKLGIEAQPETVTTRLLWAVGYFVNQNYFFRDLEVQSLPQHLSRGRRYELPDGHFAGVRLQRHPRGEKKAANWNWQHNPFVGTREFNGLRVMMALISNWDLTDNNNAVFRGKKDDTGKSDGERKPRAGKKKKEDRSSGPEEWMVTDLGTAFGSSGVRLKEATAKNNLKEYQEARFIAKVKPQYVELNFPRRPPLLYLVSLNSYLHQIHMRWIGHRIPRADAKWIGSLLAQLSEKQIGDAFRAGGYSPDQISGFTKALQARIAELNQL